MGVKILTLSLDMKSVLSISDPVLQAVIVQVSDCKTGKRVIVVVGELNLHSIHLVKYQRKRIGGYVSKKSSML